MLIAIAGTTKSNAQVACEDKLQMCIMLGQQIIDEADELIASKDAELELNRQLIEQQQLKIEQQNQWYNDPIKSGLTGVILGLILSTQFK